jgi:putative hemolysin
MFGDSGSIALSTQILILIGLTLLNAFFAAAEMATVSLNETKIKILAEHGNKKANTLLKLLKDPNKFLSTIQVGITLASFFASASAATGLSASIGSVLSDIGIPYSNQIAFFGVTVLLSYFTLVLGELFPKRVALSQSEKIAMFSVNIIIFISKVMSPFIKILALSTNLLVKITGLDKAPKEDKVTKEEIQLLINTGNEHGTINETEKEMLEGIFHFDDKKVQKVMISRTEVYCVDINEPLNNYIDELLSSRYSKIPVYQDNIDNIIGVLYIKDLVIEAKRNGFKNINIIDIIKEPYFVPEVNNVQDVFKEMQKTKKQIAIVIDEYGGFSGIVTIEDLIEEIMGEIEDEYDNKKDGIKLIKERTFLIDGITTLDEINERLNINIQADNVETLSGYLINLIGKIPVEEEEKVIQDGKIKFNIQDVSEKRIKKVLVTI